MHIVAFDTETELFGEGNMVPPVVSLALSHSRGSETALGCVSEPVEFDAMVDLILGDDEVSLVGHNAPYDLAVLLRRRPEYTTSVFDMLESGRVMDTGTREKLLNLAEFGAIDAVPITPGSEQHVRISYSLAALVKKYLGLEIEKAKRTREGVVGDADAWRLNFAELKDTPVAKWPETAVEYAKDDAIFTELVWECQEQRRTAIKEALGIDPLVTQDFRVSVKFALHMMGIEGLPVDPVEKAKIEAMIAKELAPENLQQLIQRGILLPAEPPRPHARGAKDHTPECTNKKACNCPAKMTSGKSESIAMAKLKGFVEELAAKLNHEAWQRGEPDKVTLKRTDPSEKFPEGQISVDAAWLEDHAVLSPVLTEYQKRQKLQKLITTELPRMCRADGTCASVVHPQYDELKETGRVSSFASDSVPSFNCQNVDPRARGCYVAPDGWAMFSLDFSQMELGTAAQKCFSLFGYSVLRDMINSGTDVHAYLGSQLAVAKDTDFQQSLSEAGVSLTDKMAVFQAFKECGASTAAEVIKFYERFRKFAKPTNLGYPGGLGAATFIAYAKATYGVEVTEEEAKEFKRVWLETYPEFQDYFNWINNECIDRRFSVGDDRRYFYVSPYGMYRPNCFYCAAANGAALQTPSAEGALTATFSVVRACLDSSLGSILNGIDRPVRPICFIHDELLGLIRLDDLTTPRIAEIGRLMVESMRVITPDVEARYEACLMRRWNKGAKPVWKDGVLQVWEPATK